LRMRPRIAIPVPHSGDPAYAERALPQYERAVEMAGGEPVRIPLDQAPTEVLKLIESCDAILLPGSKADVDPNKYGANSHPQAAPADTKRDTVDELLLKDADNKRKPILGICYGLQILNVHRKGTLLQHIDSPINHAAGRKVPLAHAIEIDPQSKLAEIVTSGPEAPSVSGSESARLKSCSSQSTQDQAPRLDLNREGHGFSRAIRAGKGGGALAPEENALVLLVNSSHHQSAEVIGSGLRVVARSPQDGVIEALEGTSRDHFVLAVQWHPERSVDLDESSRAIFRALVDAVRTRHEKLMGKSEDRR